GEGKVTGRGGAAVFPGEAVRKPPRLPDTLYLLKGSTEEERTCRQLIVHVHSQLFYEPERDAVVRALECELTDLLIIGPLRLPEPPAGYLTDGVIRVE